MRSSPITPPFLCAPPLQVKAIALHHHHRGSTWPTFPLPPSPAPSLSPSPAATSRAPPVLLVPDQAIDAATPPPGRRIQPVPVPTSCSPIWSTPSPIPPSSPSSALDDGRSWIRRRPRPPHEGNRIRGSPASAGATSCGHWRHRAVRCPPSWGSLAAPPLLQSRRPQTCSARGSAMRFGAHGRAVTPHVQFTDAVH